LAAESFVWFVDFITATGFVRAVKFAVGVVWRAAAYWFDGVFGDGVEGAHFGFGVAAD